MLILKSAWMYIRNVLIMDLEQNANAFKPDIYKLTV